MKTGNNGLELIKKFEGFRSEPYLCPAKVATIGYGATYYPNGNSVMMSDNEITEPEAVDLLKDMLTSYENSVNKLVKVEISQNQFDALVSFTYNLGAGALSKSTLLKKVNANCCDTTIANEFMKWNKAGGKELRGLTIRRKEESNLYFS